MRTALRLAAGLAGVLAVMLVAGTAEGALVPRTPQRIRTTSHAVAVEPKAVRGKAAAAARGSAAKAGAGRAKAGSGVAKAGVKGRVGTGKTQTRDAKDSLRESRPRAQAKRRRGRKADEEYEPPVTMWRVKGRSAEAGPKTAEREVAGRQATETKEPEQQRALTVEDFEKAANGTGDAGTSAEVAAAKNDAGKPLTKSMVRAANERAEAERAAAAERAANERAAAERAAAEKAAEEKVAAADRMAARPTGERLPMMSPGGVGGSSAKKSVEVRAPAKAAAAPMMSANLPVKASVLPQMQANGPKAAVMARATALPRLEAGSDVSDADVTSAPIVRSSGAMNVGEVGDAPAENASSGADVVRQAGPVQSAVSRDTEFDEAPLKRSMGLRAPTHEEMAEAVTQPLVLPGLYRDGRLVVPAPLKGTREILVHQNTMADAEGLERIRNESDLNRLRAMHELVNLPESESLRLNPELAANRRCARVWSVRFAEDMSRAFYARFHEPLQVNSAVRTVAFQVRLQRVNGNAAGIGGEAASPHLTGQALDFGKRGMSVEQIAWMRSYLLPLMQAGKVDVEEEFQQACFHISVYKSYLPSVPARRRGVRTEVAQLGTRMGSEAKPVRVPPPTEDEQ